MKLHVKFEIESIDQVGQDCKILSTPDQFSILLNLVVSYRARARPDARRIVTCPASKKIFFNRGEHTGGSAYKSGEVARCQIRTTLQQHNNTTTPPFSTTPSQHFKLVRRYHELHSRQLVCGPGREVRKRPDQAGTRGSEDVEEGKESCGGDQDHQEGGQLGRKGDRPDGVGQPTTSGDAPSARIPLLFS